MRPTIYGIGLTHEELHTLEVSLPLLFSFVSLSPDELDEAVIEKMMRTARCIVVNPKNLLAGQLYYLTSQHAATIDTAFTPILLLTEKAVDGQIYKLWQPDLYYHRVDLLKRFDRKRKAALLTLKAGVIPTWRDVESMKANMFNDGWYLIALETTGPNHLNDEIARIHIAYMADYRIQNLQTLEVETIYPHENCNEDAGGFRQNTISLKETVEFLEHLPNPYAPFIFWNEDYTGNFLEMAWRLCGKQFDHAYIALDGLASFVFGYKLDCSLSKLYRSKHNRRLERTPIEDEQIASLYDVTLSVFEALMAYFDIHSPQGLPTLLQDPDSLS